MNRSSRCIKANRDDEKETHAYSLSRRLESRESRADDYNILKRANASFAMPFSFRFESSRASFRALCILAIFSRRCAVRSSMTLPRLRRHRFPAVLRPLALFFSFLLASSSALRLFASSNLSACFTARGASSTLPTRSLSSEIISGGNFSRSRLTSLSLACFLVAKRLCSNESKFGSPAPGTTTDWKPLDEETPRMSSYGQNLTREIVCPGISCTM
mmetsp:Transcript_15762/g.30801  ORF Transcript_15762/g.30801 Transcript_15762/m.30801 type:complete len:216 (+) Transcript_15762:15-662(+)